MKKSFLMLLSLTVLFAVGCSNESKTVRESDNIVRFFSNIPSGVIASPRATDDGKWEANDNIGVFMTPAGQAIASALPKVNACYTAQTAGSNTSNFTATGDNVLTYPDNGNVDFYAYCPYKSDLSGLTLDLDVKANPVDYLYTKEATKNVAKTAANVVLNFNYVLPIVRFEFTDEADQVIPASEITNLTVKALQYKGRMDLNNGAITVAEEKSDLSVTGNKLLLMPQTTDVVVTLSYNGKNYTWNAKQNFVFAPATAYTFKAKLFANQAVTIDAISGVINGRTAEEGNATPDELRPDGTVTPPAEDAQFAIPTIEAGATKDFTNGAINETIPVSTDSKEWSVSSSESWLTASKVANAISLVAEANSSNTERTAIVTVTYSLEKMRAEGAFSFTVKQAAKEESGSELTELIISAYIEGKGFNKAIQVYNPTANPIDLSMYKIAMENYGKTNKLVEEKKLTLKGSLAAGDYLVIRHSSAKGSYPGKEIIDNNVCNFNGNDPVALLKGEEVIDAIGPFRAGSTTNFAADVTLHRTAEINKPSATYNEEQWTKLPKDDFSPFGKR